MRYDLFERRIQRSQLKDYQRDLREHMRHRPADNDAKAMDRWQYFRARLRIEIEDLRKAIQE